MKIHWNFSTRIQLLLPRFPLHLGKTNTTSVFSFDLSIFLLLLGCLSSVQHIERNQHGHILLSSSTWSLEHIDCVSSIFGNVFFEELWDHHKSFFRCRMDSKTWKKILVRVPSFLVLLEYHQSVLYLVNMWISLFPSSSQFWICCCLAPLFVKKTSHSFLCLFSQQ